MAHCTATCPHCGRRFEFEQYHSGFANEGYMYCDSDPTVLTWTAFDPRYTALVGERHPWTLGDDQRRAVEQAVIGCPCGGAFRFANPPRCLHCNEALRDLVSDPIYFAVIDGRRVDAAERNIWRPARPIQRRG